MGKRQRTPCRSKSCVRSRKRQARSLLRRDFTTIRHPSKPPSSLFEEYQKAQNWLAHNNNEERILHIFLSTLKRPLPVCFRSRSESTTKEFQQLLQQERLVHQARLLPGGDAWQLSASDVHYNERVRQWLATKTSRGEISRQEFVSMIPVLLLGVQGDHKVLDLCASPGSKTIQALDALYAATTSNYKPTGFVVANELDPKRAYVLAHRCTATLKNRMVSVAITCHNATKFPNVLAPLSSSNHHTTTTTVSPAPFDRIICDVPCSGDGTLRKDTKVWKTWHPSYGMELHSLQLRIAKRGIALLKMGGLMTYSTCSFHPIENEAVVAALLETGCVEIVPCDAVRALKGIRRRPGLMDWKVLNNDLQELSFNDNKKDNKWPCTLWPPPQSQHCRRLQRCIRMVPQDNDSGGFFIALLRKIKDFPVSSTEKKKKSWSAPLITPQQVHHQLFPATKDSSSGVQEFTRGPTSSRQFQLANPLAEFVTQSPGSAKLNVVYAGYNEKKKKKKGLEQESL